MGRPRSTPAPRHGLQRPPDTRVRSRSFRDDPEVLKKALANSRATHAKRKKERDDAKKLEAERAAQIERSRSAVDQIRAKLEANEELPPSLLKQASLTDLFLIAIDPKTPDKERISAHNSVLDRTEGKPLQRVEQTGQVNLTFVPADWWRQVDVIDADAREIPAGT